MSNVPNDTLYSTAYWRGLIICAGLGGKTIEEVTEKTVRFSDENGIYVISQEELEQRAAK